MGGSDRREREERAREERTTDGATSAPSGDARLRIALGRRVAMRKAERDARAGAKPAIPEGGGAPLDGRTRQRMEGALGTDLSSVRVHTGGESAAAARDMGARAFAVGNDVHFGAAQYNPGSREGDRLLAHELTHVVQGGLQPARKPERDHDDEHEELDVSQPHEPAEVEADSVADHVTSTLHDRGAKGGGGAGAKAGGGPAAAKPRIQAKLEAGASRKVWRFAEESRTAAKKEDAKRELVKVEAHPAAAAFESNLGVLAMGHSASKTASDAMMGKISSFLQSEAKGYDEVERKQTEVDADAKKLGEKLGTDPKKSPGVAGGVLASKVGEVLASGNLRERMTVLFNFMRLFDETMRSKSSKDRDELMKRADLNKSKVDAALKKMTLDAEGKVAPPADGKRPPSFINPATSVTGAMGGQDKARVETKDIAPSEQTAGSLAGSGPTVPAHDGKAEKDYKGAAALSANEIEFQQQAGAQGKDGSEDPKDLLVQWEEGDKKWAADASSEFVQKLDEVKLPFGAGPSGTTSRLFQTAEYLNVNQPDNVRLACIGYLLPIHAHSLVEIMQAASGHGCEAPVYDLTMYRKLKPLDEAELRACGGGKFPDEVAREEQERAAAAGPQSAPPAAPSDGGGGSS